MRSERDARTQTGSRGDAGERVRRSAPVDAAGGRRAIEARRRLVVGHVVLGAGARVELWSRVTRALLRGFFGDPERIPRRLPDALAAPIARLLALPPGADGRPAVVGHAFAFRRNGAELVCRVLQHPRTGRLVLTVALRAAA